MPTFHIENFGCRATQADAAALERQLLERGYAPAGDTRADVVVFNTCTVTSDADAVARQAIRRCHAENPAARILVTGCYAQRAPEELAQISGVNWVVGNSHKPQIPALLSQALRPVRDELVHIDAAPPVTVGLAAISLADGPAKILTGNIFAQADIFSAPVFEGGHAAVRTRPVLKIQDGCNNRCSYCVIPFVRGRSRSLEPARVVQEVRALIDAGAREVVLSGINLGSYGRDLVPRATLTEVVRHILDETPLERLRLSSVEPQDITQDLVDLVASNSRLARHFHVPLQSGSDRVLGAMHRWYRAEQYARRIELIHERIPAAAIGADVITGFPGESDDDHRATCDLIERLPFTYLHVFAFSKRPGTQAAMLRDEVSPPVIKKRSRELRALAERKKAAYRAAQAGSRLRVLTLARQGEGAADCSPAFQTRDFSVLEDKTPASEEAGYTASWTAALSDNYLSLRVAGHWPRNHFLDVRLDEAGAHLLEADSAVESESSQFSKMT